MRIQEIIESARDPNKSYDRLDTVFRNQSKIRSSSINPPDNFDYDEKDQQPIELPVIAPEKEISGSKKTNKKVATKQKWTRNSPSDKPKNGDLIGVSFDTAQNLSDDPIVNDFVNRFESAARESGFKTIYWLKGWVNGVHGGYTGGSIITSDNNVEISIGFNSSSRKNKKSLSEVKFDYVRLPGFKGKEDKKAKVKQILSDQEYGGYEFLNASKEQLDVKLPSDDFTSAMKQLLSVGQTIQDMGPDFDIPSSRKQKVDSSDNPAHYYEWLSQNLFNSWLNGVPSAFSRGGGESTGGYDLKDSTIVVGITKGGIYTRDTLGKKPYREHAVPSDFINNIGIKICDDMFGDMKEVYKKRQSIASTPKFIKERRRTIFRLRQMIQKCLVLVLTSTTEREYIDFEKKLMTKMPDGWNWETGNPLARFTAAKIPVYHIENNKRLAENF
jgi:hypothetical protein